MAGRAVDSAASKGKACPTGAIGGMVTDNSVPPNGLASVQINVTDATGKNVATALTQAGGSYNIASLVQGTYSMAFAKAGYTSNSITNVKLTSGATTTRNIVLQAVAPPPLASVDVTVVENSPNSPPIVGATVTIAYNSGTNPAPLVTDGNGLAHFGNQPVNVGAVVSVMTNDGSARARSVAVSGFVSGPNPIMIGIAPIPRGGVTGLVTDSTTGPPTSLAQVQVSLVDPTSGNFSADSMKQLTTPSLSTTAQEILAAIA